MNRILFLSVYLFVGIALIGRTFWCAYRWPILRELPLSWRRNKIIVGFLVVPAVLSGISFQIFSSIFGGADLIVIILSAALLLVAFILDSLTPPVIWKKTLSE